MAVKIGHKNYERDRSRNGVTHSRDNPDLLLTLPRRLDLCPGRSTRAQNIPWQKHIGNRLLSGWQTEHGRNSFSITWKYKMAVNRS
jgi:hypothetical protein